jgi:threonine/homoserine/homoserine lactone efflux protein
VVVYLISGIIYGFAAAVQPGPLSAYLVSQSLRAGWRRTLPAAFAPLISDGPIALLALIILRSVPPRLVMWLRLLGGVFVIYLAAAAWKAWRNYRAGQADAASSAYRNVLKAATVNLLNPNPFLGWTLVLGPLALKGWRESPLSGIAVIVGFYAAMIASLAAIILVFHATGSLGQRVNRLLIGVSAVALVLFGFYQLWLGLLALIGDAYRFPWASLNAEVLPLRVSYERFTIRLLG